LKNLKRGIWCFLRFALRIRKQNKFPSLFLEGKYDIFSAEFIPLNNEAPKTIYKKGSQHIINTTIISSYYGN